MCLYLPGKVVSILAVWVWNPDPDTALALPTGSQCPSCTVGWAVCEVLSLGTADKWCHLSCVCEPQFQEPTMLIRAASRIMDLACSHPEFVQAGMSYACDFPPSSHEWKRLQAF